MPALVALFLAPALPVPAQVVVEAGMASHCAEAAATELGVMMNDVLTLPVERSGGTYHVYGQYPDSGSDLTLFECQYDSGRSFLGISLQGHQGHHGDAVGGVPRAAQRACTDMMGRAVTIEQVSALRPGFHEIIMKESDGPRRVACTVADDGTLEDWVEMN
ncbi:hypothetical protein RISW2_05980 [Roseivivax isoporae LMG 25204]|uniref:Uncharacterized protein n=1 Tax=Roseivivax isoporae LMG 25204 TaxID=1449351 RepID=X7F6V8_9RHOB|nr:hypothetical protein RISW2_05980 [Roseivivax isoporae LMG 25204]